MGARYKLADKETGNNAFVKAFHSNTNGLLNLTLKSNFITKSAFGIFLVYRGFELRGKHKRAHDFFKISCFLFAHRGIEKNDNKKR